MKNSITEETKKKITQLQMYEQNVNTLLQQKQALQQQLAEVEGALSELENSKESYKIIGNIMVKTDSEELKKEILSKKNIASIRVKSIEKQENIIKDKAKALQDQVSEEMNMK